MTAMRHKIALLLALTLVLAVAASASDAKPNGALKRVETKTVCMINEHAMGKDQIPVEIDGKTYYGCCEMCKQALAQSPEKRVSVDPLTGRGVDKALAVIAAQEDGRVFYFESEETLAKWNAKFKK